MVHRRTDDGSVEGEADLFVAQRGHLEPGGFCDMLPPEGDIHSLTTTGDVPSVSLHRLGADIGCRLRHSFDPNAHKVQAFKSGWANAPCEEDER